jgi:BASS family bile acid:Na+ symporter
VKTWLDIGVLCVIILMMTAVGMEVAAQQFSAVAKQKRTLLLMLAAQAALLPASAIALTRLFGLPPYVGTGLLLIAACPIGDIANFYVVLARTNAALSVSLNALSVAGSALSMAAVFAMYEHLLGTPFMLTAPTPTLIGRSLGLLVVPLLAGMAIRHYWPAGVARYGPALHCLIVFLIAAQLWYVLESQRELVAAHWRQTASAAAVFILVALGAGFAIGGLLRISSADRFTIGIGFAVRNVAIAVAIAIAILDRIEFAGFAVVYFLIEVPLLLAAVAIYRMWGNPAGMSLATAHKSPRGTLSRPG